MQPNSSLLIKTWGDFGKRIKRASKNPINPIVLIKSLQAMNEPIKEIGRLNKIEIERLLKKSEDQLSEINLSEPLHLDFFENRWFAGSREEGFSNWLVWIMKQMETSDLLKIVGVEEPNLLQVCKTETARIDREVCVDEGHDEHTGRIDILIHFEQSEVIINVEVKVTNAEEADLLKNGGYAKSLKSLFPEGTRLHRLLVINALKERYENYDYYEVLTWENICQKLRQIVRAGNTIPNMLSRALCLGFVGAVEQTLLGFSKTSFYNSQLLEYLEKITK